ncbi:hypothetical protein [Paenibacillus bovis]|uniref:DNA-binding protein n=1 Tax=Paenibacillus bovis TaxID=1616788 RepID=A0A172ZBU8_9BACL|nr:hypothetical protein [Paenibacillus bovis]ANF94640.1 hypothetical protein AR543_00390 [Paenibacillus bovis]
MTQLKTLRHELEKEILQRGYSLSSFSRLSGVNRGVLSATLNSKIPKPISIHQLDQMNLALDKPPGWLYDLFIEECFSAEEKSNWRRVRSLIIRCVELQRSDLINRILYLLLDDPSYIDEVFRLAENLIQKEENLAILLYKYVIEYERNSHSERLAVSHYRIFKSLIGNNIETNLKAALTFAPHRNLLPVPMQLDALLKLANIYYSLQDWEQAVNMADELYRLSSKAYQLRMQARQNHGVIPFLDLERPLVVYYGQGLLLKCAVYEEEEKYDKAQIYVDLFADLQWFEDEHAENQYYIDRFRFYSIIHTMNLELLTGKEQVLDRYLQILEQHPQEVLPSTLIIIEAANKYGYNVDPLLSRYEDIIYPADILDYLIAGSKARYNYQDVTIGINRYIDLYYQLAIYYCDRNVYDERLEKILYTLESTIEQYNRGRIMDCLHLFKRLRKLTESLEKQV